MKIPGCDCGHPNCDVHRGMVRVQRTDPATIAIYGEFHWSYPNADLTALDAKDKINCEAILETRKQQRKGGC